MKVYAVWEDMLDGAPRLIALCETVELAEAEIQDHLEENPSNKNDDYNVEQLDVIMKLNV